MDQGLNKTVLKFEKFKLVPCRKEHSTKNKC